MKEIRAFGIKRVPALNKNNPCLGCIFDMDHAAICDRFVCGSMIFVGTDENGEEIKNAD